MSKIKDILSIIFGSSLVIEGRGRTYAKAPMWLAVLLGVTHLWMAALTALLVVAFGMKASVVRN